MCQLRKDHAHASLRSRLDVIRSWSDDEFDSDHDLAESPVGAIELDDADLALATGGMLTAGCGCGAQPSHHCSVV
jgi:hypothetical protein